MSFDISNEDAARAYALLPLGFHLVTITEAARGTSSGSYPQIELTVENDGGETLRDRKVVTPSSTPFVLQLTDAAGIDRDKLVFEDEEEAAEKIAALILGKKIGVKVIEEQKRSDPSKMVRVIDSYWLPSDLPAAATQAKADVPADTRGLAPVGASADDPDIPF